MENVSNFLENRIVPPMLKLANQRHLTAVRDGLIATIPLTIIGSFFLLAGSLPFPQFYVDFLNNNPELVNKLYIPFNMSVGLLSIYASFGIGSNLARSYKLNALSGGVSSLITFLVTLSFTPMEEGTFLSVQYLGGEGLFTSILTAFFAVEVMRLCEKHDLVIKLPEQVPPNVSSSFSSLIPIFLSIVPVWLLIHVIGFDINSLIATLVTPLLSASANSIISPLIYVVLTAIMWFFGMHPAVLAAIMSPVWLVNSEVNMLAAQAGEVIPNLGVKPFIFTFIWIGGGGGTLALCLLMAFSKSEFMKKLGRMSLLPGLFNINEPLLFGLPFVLNPAFVIPLVLAPVVVTLITYFAFISGLVPGMAYPLAAEWTVPSIVAGGLVTGSFRGVLLVLINFFVYLLIYYPFFKSHEKRLVAQENAELNQSGENESPVTVTSNE